MRGSAGVAEVANAVVEVTKIRLGETKELSKGEEGEPKKLAVVRGKVNPCFYEDDTLTPRGKRKLERAFNEGQARIQGKREKLLEEGRRIQRLEEQIKNRKGHFTLEVKTFEERFKQPVYIC